jgi:Copper type II ascorbate-dependent monooxygenase, C-terminal domain
VDLEASKEKNPTEVGITLFGAADIHLAPHQSTAVEHTCSTDEDLTFYAVLPHMHAHGTRLDLELFADDGTFTQIYSRESFDYADQYFEPFPLTLPKGSKVRIRCSYQNDDDKEIAFGESAKEEMCFAVSFTVAGPPLSFCSDFKPPFGATFPVSPDAGQCAPATRGIGQPCTEAGGQCDSDLFCSADFLHNGAGLCFRIGCEGNGDCAGGNTCCTLAGIGDLANFCFPEACRPENCIPLSEKP